MKVYSYIGKDLKGQLVKGSVWASSEVQAKKKLQSKLSILTTLNMKSELFASSAKVSAKDIQVFTRQFSVLLGAGISISQALSTLSESAYSPAMSGVLKSIYESVSKGQTLANSLKAHPKVFDNFYVSLVAVGEISGSLDEVLIAHSAYLDRMSKLNGQIKGALMYPAIIVVVSVGVIWALLTFVVPSLAQMIDSSGQELPAMTKIVLALSKWCVEYWYVMVLLPIALFVSFAWLRGNQAFRRATDRFFLQLPLVGSFIIKSELAKIFRALVALLKGGVDTLQSVTMAKDVANNVIIKDVLSKTTRALSQGQNFYEPFLATGFVPKVVVDMIKTGEISGKLDMMLGKIADFYEEEIEIASGTILKLIEPVLLVGLGGIVGFLVISMYLPIFKLAGGSG